MTKQLAIVSALLLSLTSCGTMNEMLCLINDSTEAITYNRYAIENSTQAICENAAVVNASTRTLQENRRVLESVGN